MCWCLLEPLWGQCPIPPVQHKALGIKPEVTSGEFPNSPPRRSGCWTSRSLSPGHCSVTEMGWWCAGNSPTFGVTTFLQIISHDKGAAFNELCQLSYLCTSCKRSFGLDLAAPFIQKFQSDLSILFRCHRCLVKYLFRVPKSIRNGCGDPSWRSMEQSLPVGQPCLVGSMGMLLGDFNLLNFEPTSSFSVQSVL